MAVRANLVPSDLWIKRYRPSSDTATRLVCFPHAGGSASVYLPLAIRLAPEIDVLAVQYPGRQERLRERGPTDIRRLADQITDAIQPHITGRDASFFGHSMGALVAYEVALRLEAGAGIVLKTLYASGRPAPSCPWAYSIDTSDDDSVLARLLDLGGVDRQMLSHEESRAMVLSVVRGDLRMVQEYRWAPSSDLGCPITVLVGDQDPITPVDQAWGWVDHSTAGAHVQVFRGGHFFLDDHLEEISAMILADDRLSRNRAPWPISSAS